MQAALQAQYRPDLGAYNSPLWAGSRLTVAMFDMFDLEEVLVFLVRHIIIAFAVVVFCKNNETDKLTLKQLLCMIISHSRERQTKISRPVCEVLREHFSRLHLKCFLPGRNT